MQKVLRKVQGYANSFRGDVVLDSFNMAYMDENSILDQIYQNQIFSDFYYEGFEF